MIKMILAFALLTTIIATIAIIVKHTDNPTRIKLLHNTLFVSLCSSVAIVMLMLFVSLF